ncbi:hypothetical protein [Bradyrhizobium sp. NAS80.1]|uniref:hypothetical protein n=1 Tax=Bradyrhizobium sp. NAS80.1 TaxID=1680159 RepID=UPI001FD92C43|nr:hypothetical protein [Bradyrhizobium sp. NAS80.1]
MLNDRRVGHDNAIGPLDRLLEQPMKDRPEKVSARDLGMPMNDKGLVVRDTEHRPNIHKRKRCVEGDHIGVLQALAKNRNVSRRDRQRAELSERRRSLDRKAADIQRRAQPKMPANEQGCGISARSSLSNASDRLHDAAMRVGRINLEGVKDSHRDETLNISLVADGEGHNCIHDATRI